MGNEATDERESIQQVYEALGIVCTATPIATPSPWGGASDGWHVVLKRGSATLEQDYWQGIGHREWVVFGTVKKLGEIDPWQLSKYQRDGWRKVENSKVLPPHISKTLHHEQNTYYRPAPPKGWDVLGCLCSDASGIDCGESFEDWCSNLGYDTDSRKAETTYRKCQGIALRLRGFLGEHYDRCRDAEY